MPTIEADRRDFPAIIATDRLRLRFFRADDLDRLVSLAGEYEVVRWLARLPYPYRREDGADFIAAVGGGLSDAGELVYAIAAPDDDRVMGALGLILDGAQAELGYWLGRPHQGRGYAMEAVRALLDLGFGALGLARIYADVQAANVRSRHLLERLGFSHTGEASIYLMIEKRYVMGPRYELTRAEWKKLQS